MAGFLGYAGVLANSAQEALLGSSEKGKRSLVNILEAAACVGSARFWFSSVPDSAILLTLTFASAKLGVSLIGKISTGGDLLREKFPAILGNTWSAEALATAVAGAAVSAVSLPMIGEADPIEVSMSGIAPIVAAGAVGVFVVDHFLLRKCCDPKPVIPADAATLLPV